MKRFLFFSLLALLLAACQDKGRVVEPKDGPAHLALAEHEYDYGLVKNRTDVLTHEFRFVNDGSEKLVITDVNPLCHCLKVDYSKEPIKPGHAGMIKVMLNVADLTTGFFSRSVDISTNRNHERISVKGKVAQ